MLNINYDFFQNRICLIILPVHGREQKISFFHKKGPSWELDWDGLILAGLKVIFTFWEAEVLVLLIYIN